MDSEDPGTARRPGTEENWIAGCGRKGIRLWRGSDVLGSDVTPKDQPQIPIAGAEQKYSSDACLWDSGEEGQGLNCHIPSISEGWLMQSRGVDARCLLRGA